MEVIILALVSFVVFLLGGAYGAVFCGEFFPMSLIWLAVFWGVCICCSIGDDW